jgi:mRNA-degrading endonuclease RelE of RelBE toxin-antitoxin system
VFINCGVALPDRICKYIGVYEIEFSEGVLDELSALRAFDRQRILDHIEEQLSSEPSRTTRHRKILVGLMPSFKAVPPIWQLAVGKYRVFYDVNEERRTVYVRAVRHKPPHRMTEEIL